MGNAPSGEMEPARLKEELADMNRSLQTLGVRCRPPPILQPGQISVDNVIIRTREDVKVVLGPVVGKVEFQRARVLLEVDRRALVTAHVSTLDAATNSMVELPHHQVAVQCEADRPAVFVLERLVPGRSYTVTFGGVRSKDVKTKRGRLRTQSVERSNTLNVAVVSGDNVFDLESGEANLWQDVRERVARDETQIVLHLGGQVAMQRMFDKAVQLLLLYGHGTASVATVQPDWAMMEAKALDVLRAAYRSQWTLSPNLQFVLANACNLMMWSDADVYPRFTTRGEFYIDHEQPTLQMQVIRTVTRCARRLFHEYQRQLWDDEFKQLVEREVELLAIAERALASTAQIFALSGQIPKTAEELELQKKRHEIEGARRVEKNLRALEAEKTKLEKQVVSFNQVLAPQRGEEFVFEVGNICILVLDLRSSRLEPGGSQARDNELMSNVQWRFIEETLERSSVQLLLVCSEAPLIDDLPSQAKSSVAANYEEIETAWSANRAAQARLLSQLFDWKLQQPNRQFVVLAGANPVRCFARMRMKDTKLRTEAEQFTVGAISAAPHDSAIPRRNGLLHGRFEFEHLEEVVNKKCFLALKLESGQSNAIEACRVGRDKQSYNPPKVLLGPVVGWVDEFCAVVLLEVDRDADVVCLVKNSLTGESRRVFQRFFADRANSFFITHLRSGHYYRLSFENVQHPERFRASFTTVAKSPQHFDVVALGNESRALNIPGMSSGDKKDANLWHTIKENTVKMPFIGLNLTIHLGGQFFPDSNSHIHEALVYAGNNMASPNQLDRVTESEELTTAMIHRKFREMYRATWNTPGMCESLAHGAHLILTNENDQLPANNQEGEDQQNVNIREQLTKFHVRYQNLLLPPSKRLRGDEVRWRKPLSHCFGAFGLFVLPKEELGGSFIHESTWEALGTMLETPTLTTLLLVSTEALVDESLEDIREKACMDSAYRRKFGFFRKDVKRLLEILFNWQRIDPTDKASEVKKQVVLLSGSRYQSFDSVIQEIYDNERILTNSMFPNFPTADRQVLFQYVVGPLQASNSGIRPRLFFNQGTLLERYTYQNSFVRKAPLVDDEVSSGLPTTGDESIQAGRGEIKLNEGVSATEVTNQFIHLSLSMSDESPTDAAELDSTEVHVPTSYGICSFISHDPIQADTRLDEDKADVRVSGQVRYCHVGAWKLSTALPVWLRELLAQATTEAEENQVKDRMTYLREQQSELQASFQRTPALVNGLVSLSNAKACADALAASFKLAHRLGPRDLREYFPTAPSSFLVVFTLQQLRTSDPPVQQLSSVGAVEFEQYALIFQHSFVNSWLLNERLEHFWS
ncbi:hypothetical protein PF005_g11586 [Phytophthora fragariae]|uniref:Uncharacterized protein n=2 Tax=Phytophthora fragariae TaxID=53985 RepID=A0A6A3EYC3_9STRA|nr:hypothetical protein PF003_g8068 [Phytophthora fragariae]KAE8937417.1 hypothetical protein PF009_g12676 [Phytophthora fragariae]KAE9009368.1 hypothetical protein PF011_g10300 [Phytophthora fragariae]KAE9107545.1 hypothetical protein PF010_g12228 [Phytophthora fragariae]KAE9110663.1 hypothetical protein PF007_g11780 [Phytophthora fragariae]